MTQSTILRLLFFVILVRPLVLIFLGLNVRHGERLPKHGPALVVANHNSHLDTLVLLSLFPLSRLHKVKAAGAADYFFKTRPLAWVATHLIGVLPVTRAGKGTGKAGNPLAAVFEALRRDEIVILFPEGSRGEPERLTGFKRGITVLAQKFPQVPVTPIFLHGLGKALPKGDFLFVPFFCDIFVGSACCQQEVGGDFAQHLFHAIEDLSKETPLPTWD